MGSGIIEILEEHQAQYLSKGNIELLSLGEKKFDEYHESGMAITIATSLSMKKGVRQIIVMKLSDKYLIEVSSNLELYNIGILKSISKKLLATVKQLPEFSK